MKLVTFGINKERNLIVQFPVYIQPYIQQQLILYEIEMVAVPIIDLNKNGTFIHSFTGWQALHSNKFWNIYFLENQELRMCKNIVNEFYKEKIIFVNDKSKYSCESIICFNLGSKSIKENCNFAYYFNKTNIKPAVLHGGMKLFWEIDLTINALNVI